MFLVDIIHQHCTNLITKILNLSVNINSSLTRKQGAPVYCHNYFNKYKYMMIYTNWFVEKEVFF